VFDKSATGSFPKSFTCKKPKEIFSFIIGTLNELLEIIFSAIEFDIAVIWTIGSTTKMPNLNIMILERAELSSHVQNRKFLSIHATLVELGVLLT